MLNYRKNNNIQSGEWFFFITAAVAVFCFLGTRSFYGSEDRWAEIVREMLLTKDYFHPATNFVVYFDKPLLSYWLIALSATLCGSLNEWSLRLPSAIFGMIGLWATVRTFGKMFTREIGLLAGWMLLGSWGFMWWARSAEADIENMTMIILAFGWFYHCREKAGFLHYLLFYLLLFVGAQFKGIPAIAVPLVAAGVFMIVKNQWRWHLKFSNLLAAVIACGVFFIPAYLAEITPLYKDYVWPDKLSALDLVWRENVVRVFNAFDHDDEPVFVYTYELQRVLLPWSIFFIMALFWGGWRWRRLNKDGLALLIAIIVIFVMFSISESRRWYYILPIAPFCMGFTALYICEEGVKAKFFEYLLRVVRYAAMIAGSLAVLSLLMWPFWMPILKLDLPVLMLVAIPVLGFILLVILCVDEGCRQKLAGFVQLDGKIAATIIVMAVSCCGVFAAVIPATEVYRTYKLALLEAKEKFGHIPESNIILYSHDKNCPLLYYWNFSSPMKVIIQRDTARKNDPQSALEAAESYQELHRHIVELAGGKNDILLISFERNMNILAKHDVAEDGFFDRKTPDFKEPSGEFEGANKRKFWFWVIKPEDVSITK